MVSSHVAADASQVQLAEAHSQHWQDNGCTDHYVVSGSGLPLSMPQAPSTSLDHAISETGDSGVPGGLQEYIDWALEKSNGWGRFQHTYCVLLAMPWAIAGMQTLAHIFVTMAPNRRRICIHQTAQCHQELVPPSDCSVPRNGYEYEPAATSVIAEFDLVCASSHLVPLLGTFFFLGFLLGALFYGRMSDHHGRRRAYLHALLTVESGALLAVLSPNYFFYASARLLTGVGTGGLGIATYTWNAELLGADSRAILAASTNAMFAVGVLALSPLSYMLPQWRWFSAALFASGIPLLVYYPHLVESPKWLAGPGQNPDEAYNVICVIAATNNRPSPPRPPLPRVQAAQMSQEGNPSEPNKQGVLQQLVIDERLSRRFQVMCLTWFALSFGYYGISLNVSNLGWSLYVSSALSAAVELPMYPLALWLVNNAFVGRRGATAGGLITGGVCCLLCTAVVSPNGIPTMSLLLLVYMGKAAVSLAFSVVYLYATELFPTDLRSRSLGLQSFCARIAGMIAPVVADLGKVAPSLALVAFGAPCVIAGISLVSLPETRGQPLPDTIEDVSPPVGTCWECLQRYRQLDEDQHLGNTPAPVTLGAQQ